jgi:hypothetical protein
VFDIARVIHPGLPMDVRVILAGYFPNYAYDIGATDTSIPFENLRELSHIDAKAALADADPAFSARIREEIPWPRRRGLAPILPILRGLRSCAARKPSITIAWAGTTGGSVWYSFRWSIDAAESADARADRDAHPRDEWDPARQRLF